MGYFTGSDSEQTYICGLMQLMKSKMVIEDNKMEV